jgi:S-adenosylmethionine decarboxylase
MDDSIVLGQLGTDSGARAPTAEPSRRGTETSAQADTSSILPTCENADHFVTKDGITFAGTHLIVDLWGAQHLDDPDRIDLAFRKAIDACKATLLHIHLHRFLPSGGISGVAVLAESHISIHTWPERGYAAIDVFMCGVADPNQSIGVLREAFKPTHVQMSEIKRGMV